jgi:hypothetical protein
MSTTQNVLQLSKEQGIHEIWNMISEDVANSFRMDDEEKKRFKEKRIAKLIGSIPFLAGCKDAERTAVTHLGTYVLSCRETKHYYNANELDNETVFERLRLISTFKGGNQRIIDKGMSLIALIMISDYRRDIGIDDAIGKYNPVGDGAFDFNMLQLELLEKVNSVECVQMDEIYSWEGDAEPDVFWSW